MRKLFSKNVISSHLERTLQVRGFVDVSSNKELRIVHILTNSLLIHNSLSEPVDGIPLDVFRDGFLRAYLRVFEYHGLQDGKRAFHEAVDIILQKTLDGAANGTDIQVLTYLMENLSLNRKSQASVYLKPFLKGGSKKRKMIQ